MPSVSNFDQLLAALLLVGAFLWYTVESGLSVVFVRLSSFALAYLRRPEPTPLAEGQRIHHNFVKPHAALEGQTPAQRAGLVVEGENKWLSLIRAALTREAGEN